ncbi:zf-DHHC-domain-containing protein [Patellaria atrata CBS 101060]|uniref:Palmitoyltransferase n=1 Tax=Patellaria atrata CBS 101060 TaxID=1346257 RepID=A0A9P4VM75_9PEZI|nr:zf-DHHC-domain-containing protein [Patellaria atrata CBS 101060]
MLASPSPPNSPSFKGRRRGFARRCERYCCNTVTYFPLVFVYGLSSWAAWVLTRFRYEPTSGFWRGQVAPAVSVILYLLLNWCYTCAVFTSPGSPLDSMQNNGYSSLPSTNAPPPFTSFTVKSTGDIRYCKKCQCNKPDRAHHCSTCGKCVLKMDHHCPWLATCVGLRNHKAFLLFLIYTSLFCIVDCAATGSWLYYELANDGRFEEAAMPVHYILLVVMSGIIGLVLTGFTAWHIVLVCRGQTTIENLEKTRYLSPLRQHMQQNLDNRHYVDGDVEGRPSIGDQLMDIHANALPGVTRPEEGVDGSSSPYSPAQQYLRRSYADIERQRERDRYNDYLEELELEKLPNAFDVGWRRNVQNVFGKNHWLWLVPISTHLCDGWSWEANPKWIDARERMARKRDEQVRQQKERERAAGWGRDSRNPSPERSPPRVTRHYYNRQSQAPSPLRYETGTWEGRDGSERRYLSTTSGVLTRPAGGRRSPNKADQILGRSREEYSDGPPGLGTPMQYLGRKKYVESSDEDDYESSSDEDMDRRAVIERQRSGEVKPMETTNWNDVPDDMIGSRRKGSNPGVGRGRSRGKSD